jgi:quinol monooxygenase YgiN
MIKVVAKQYVKEGRLDEFLPIAKTLVEETNKNDAGCIRYEMFQDLSNPLIVTVIEEWESDATLDAHMKSGHFTGLIPQIGALCEKQADINLYKKLF